MVFRRHPFQTKYLLDKETAGCVRFSNTDETSRIDYHYSLMLNRAMADEPAIRQTKDCQEEGRGTEEENVETSPAHLCRHL